MLVFTRILYGFLIAIDLAATAMPPFLDVKSLVPLGAAAFVAWCMYRNEANARNHLKWIDETETQLTRKADWVEKLNVPFV